MPYTRAELLQAVRTDHPEFKTVDDNSLFRAIATDHPDLAKGISELKGADPNGKPAEPSLLQGFMSEAKKNTGNLVDAIQHAGQYRDAQTGEMKEASDPGAEALLSAITPMPPGTQWEGFGKMFMQSPAAEAIKGIAGVLNPAARDAAAAGKQLLTRTGIINPELSAAQQIEQKLAPTSTYGKRLAQDAASKLSADDGLLKSSPGLPFDRTLYWKFQNAGKDVTAAEAAISDQTPVNTEFIKTKMDDLIDRYKSVGADDAVRALKNQQTRLTDQGAEMPWDQYVGFQRRLGNDLEKSGVWKRLASDAANEKDHALAQAYGEFIKTTNGISPELGKANEAFTTFHDALQAAGIDTQTGRRIANIGTELPPSLARRAAEFGGKAALTGAGGAAAVKAYNALKP